jgi:hypothetical protein
MRLLRERDHSPGTWFAWRPVRASAAGGSPAGIVWLETVECEYIPPTWGGGGKTIYRRLPAKGGIVAIRTPSVGTHVYVSGARCECRGHCHRGEPEDQFGGPRPCLSKVG